jgi:hypothetical protein
MRLTRRTAAVIAVTGVAMAIALSAMAKPTQLHVVSACPAKERWQIKTLSDPDVGKVRVNKIVHTTVARLRLSKPSVTIMKNTPRLSSERTRLPGDSAARPGQDRNRRRRSLGHHDPRQTQVVASDDR